MSGGYQWYIQSLDFKFRRGCVLPEVSFHTCAASSGKLLGEKYVQMGHDCLLPCISCFIN